MKIQSNKFINTWKIVEYLGNDVATKFPQIHADPRRDTTSFLHVFGKIKVSRWKKKLLNTISVLCKVSDTTVEDVEKFIQTVCYPGREEESFTETRVQLYSQMKRKTSRSLPPE